VSTYDSRSVTTSASSVVKSHGSQRFVQPWNPRVEGLRSWKKIGNQSRAVRKTKAGLVGPASYGWYPIAMRLHHECQLLQLMADRFQGAPRASNPARRFNRRLRRDAIPVPHQKHLQKLRRRAAVHQTLNELAAQGRHLCW